MFVLARGSLPLPAFLGLTGEFQRGDATAFKSVRKARLVKLQGQSLLPPPGTSGRLAPQTELNVFITRNRGMLWSNRLW
jgi:hypothetical protein